jgi:hypothetical protein
MNRHINRCRAAMAGVKGSHFFENFAEIVAAQDAPPVSLTSVANAKNRQKENFLLFLLDTVG